MAGEAPDVVIPVRLDNAKALKNLAQLEYAGDASAGHIQAEMGKAAAGVAKVGTEGEQSGQRLRKGMEEGGQGVAGLTGSIGTLVAAQVGLATIERAAAAMGSEFKRSADYVKSLAKDFSDLRQTMQQVAALRGEQNTDKFTLQQAQMATKASLTPEEWRGFQEQFQSYGGAYLEGDQSRFKDREVGGKKVSAEKQAEEYQAKLAEFSKARGTQPTDIAELGGALLQFSKGPQEVGQLEDRLGKIFTTLERAPTPVPQLIPQMTRVMSQGGTPEEAAELIAIQSEANKGEEEVHTRAPLMQLSKLVREGKGAELGIDEKMSPLEMVKAASTKLAAESGGDKQKLEKRLDELGFNDRALVGMEGFVNRGVIAGGFTRVEGYQNEGPSDYVEQTLKKYEASDAGQAAKRAAERRLAQAERGARQQAVMAAREEAQTELVREGEPERATMGRALRGAVGWATGTTADEQIEGQRALENVRKKAQAAGVSRQEIDAQGARLGPDVQAHTQADAAFRTTKDVNDEILATLRAIAEHTKAGAENTKGKDGKTPQTRLSPAMPAKPPQMPRAPGG